MTDDLRDESLDDAPPRYRVWDPAAYRRFAAEWDDDVAAAREEGAALADTDRELGYTPAASPMTLWGLLADVAAGNERSRAALVACVAHAGGKPRTLVPVDLVPDPETALIQALGGREPKDRAAWPAYLASLAAEVAAEGGFGAKPPKGPLAHVRERATQLVSDLEDEIQEAVAAAYEAGASAGDWDDATGTGTRQAQVAGATDVLDRVVADGRVERAIAVAGAKALPVLTGDDDPSALVAAAFPAGLAVWREAVRAIVRGEVVPGREGWRGALWGLQVAFAAGAGEIAAVRTGSRIVREAAERAGVADVVTA